MVATRHKSCGKVWKTWFIRVAEALERRGILLAGSEDGRTLGDRNSWAVVAKCLLLTVENLPGGGRKWCDPTE